MSILCDFYQKLNMIIYLWIHNGFHIFDPKCVVLFCWIPRTRREIEQFLDCENSPKVRIEYIKRLTGSGYLKMTIPHAPNSPNQRYYTDLDALNKR